MGLFASKISVVACAVANVLPAIAQSVFTFFNRVEGAVALGPPSMFFPHRGNALFDVPHSKE